MSVLSEEAAARLLAARDARNVAAEASRVAQTEYVAVLRELVEVAGARAVAELLEVSRQRVYLLVSGSGPAQFVP